MLGVLSRVSQRVLSTCAGGNEIFLGERDEAAKEAAKANANDEKALFLPYFCTYII